MSANLLGLGENPFAAGHDPRLVHVTPERADILSRVRQALESGEPFVVITGETGIGKTSVVTEALAGQRLWTAVITNPSLTRAELLEEICLRFGVDVPEHGSKPKLLSRLERHLGEVRQAGDTPVLVIDEAHDLSVELLEELRLLSNLEFSGRPLLPIVLVGLPRLEARLGEPGLEQLRQRVAVHGKLRPMDAEESERYIHHRVAVAGGEGAERFPRETCLEIHRLARGVPRAINALAGRAMLAASRESERTVTAAHVQASAADTWLRSVSEGAPPAPSSSAPRPARKARETAATDASPKTTSPKGAPARAAADIPPPAEAAPPRPATESEVRDWVSRFVDPDNPVVIGARMLPVFDDLDRLGAIEDAGSETDDPSLPPIPGVATPRRAGPPLERRRRGRGGDTTWLAVAAAAVIAAAGAVVLLPRLLQVESRTAPLAQARPASVAAPAGTPAAATGLPAAAPADTAARPKRRLGLEVATYLDPYRASAESERLGEATGLSARVLESKQGDEAYRIVLGSFGSRRRAESAADDLIARGLVDQAIVVPLGKSRQDAP